MEDWKAVRKTKKTSLTKQANQLKRYVEEGDVDVVNTRRKLYVNTFKEFDEAHENIDSTTVESEEYYNSILQAYTETLKHVNIWLKDLKLEKNSESKMVKLLTLPKLEIDKFTGNPEEYLSFIAMFEECVEEVADTDQERLSRLLQLTCDVAHNAIKPCALIGGSKGYKEARTILKSRFGSTYLIADRIITELRSNKVAHTPAAVQKLADDVANAERVLESLGHLQQVDTQATIIDVADRLAPSVRDDWRRKAIKLRQRTGRYPTFHELVTFLQVLADSLNDPVYGIKSSKSKSVNAATTFANPVESSLSTSNSSTHVSGKTACPKCGLNHRLFYCKQFKLMKPVDRFDFVITKKLCENCFSGRHKTVNCGRESVCSVPNCGKRHSRFIHVHTDTPPCEKL